MKKNVFKKISSIIGWLVLGFLVVLSIWSMVDKFSGYKYPIFGIRSSVIISESMETVHESNAEALESVEDRYYKYDLIFAKRPKSPEDIKKHDVIIFHSPGIDVMIVHRVHDSFYDSESGAYWFKTRGDANSIDDPLVHFEDIQGVVTKRIRGMGDFVLYVQSPYGVFALSLVGVIFFGTWLYIVFYDERQDKKAAKVPDDKKHSEDFPPNEEEK